MRLEIQSMALENFKGIARQDITLKDDVTVIAGPNGSGKTTIADAITFCLFGEDHYGQQQFGIKTRDSEGKEIPHLEHAVTLNITIDGKPKTLKRVYRETWVKPRGQEQEQLTGNVTEYYIDGEKQTKTLYDQFIYSLAPAEVFQLLSTPGFFPSMHWKEQRDRLVTLAGNITDAEIVAQDPLLKEVADSLRERSLDDLRRHTAYHLKEVRQKCKDMPVKVEALTSTLPDVAMDDIAQDLEDAEAYVDTLNHDITQALTDPDDAARQTLRKKIRFTQDRIDNIYKSKRNLARIKADERDTEIRKRQKAQREADELTQILNAKCRAQDRIIDEANRALKELRAKQELGKQDWLSLMSRKIDMPDDITLCLTCGQYLPEAQAKAAVDKVMADFRSRLARDKQAAMDDAAKLKKEIADVEATKKEAMETLTEADWQTQEAAAVAVALKNQPEIPEPPTADELLAADDNYKALLKELEALKAQETEPQKVDIEPLRKKLDEAKTALRQLRLKDAAQAERKRITALIDKAKQEWQDLNLQLTEWERQDDIIRRYTEIRDTMLEERVNSHFRHARFRLFRTQVDGQTREPFCTVTLNGVPYADLNNAARIAVGLDIIQAFSAYYDASVPIVIDNAEAITDIPSTPGQQLRLYVRDQPTLTID